MPRKRNLGRGIVERTDGRLCGVIRLPNGDRQFVYSHKGELADDFGDRFDRLRSGVREGQQIPPQRLTLRQFLDQWLEAVGPSSAPLSPVAYRQSINRLDPLIGGQKMKFLATMDIQRAYGVLLEKLAPNTVQATHRMLHSALADAVKWQILPRNPATGAEVPQPPVQTMQVFTQEEVHHLLEATAPDRYHPLWALMVTTGLRLGEATGLLWEDVDLQGKRLTVQRTLQRQRTLGMVLKDRPKTSKSRRTVRLADNVVGLLHQLRIRQAEERLRLGPAWRGTHNLVFTNEAGGPIDSSRIQTHWKRTVRRAELQHIRLHDLRHTAATLALKWGIHPKKVQEMLGHSTIRTTLDLYSHVLPTMHEEAAQRMDGLF